MLHQHIYTLNVNCIQRESERVVTENQIDDLNLLQENCNDVDFCECTTLMWLGISCQNGITNLSYHVKVSAVEI